MTDRQRKHEGSIFHSEIEERITEARMLAADYLLSRQSDTGGFCFYHSITIDEPNLHDTYHAVAALFLLGIEVPRKEALVRYLCTTQAAGLDYLYFCACTLDLLHVPSLTDLAHLSGIRDLRLSAADVGSAVTTSNWLANTLKAARLQQRFGVLSPAQGVVRHIQNIEHDGGYGDTPNLSDTCQALLLLSILGEPSTSRDTRDFVERKQLPGYGFTLTDNSRLSNVEVLYDGVRCCRMLSLPIKFTTDILAFVLGCQAAVLSR